MPGGLSLQKRFVGVLGLAGGSCACFGFACNGSPNKISCSTEKTLLAIAGGIWDFKMLARDLQVSCPQFCLAQPCWQSLDV